MAMLEDLLYSPLPYAPGAPDWLGGGNIGAPAGMLAQGTQGFPVSAPTESSASSAPNLSSLPVMPSATQGIQQPAAQGGFDFGKVLNGVGGFLANNPNLLIGLGAGIAKGGVPAALAGAQAGISADKASRAQNYTMQALIKKGYDPATAYSIVNNPLMMKNFAEYFFRKPEVVNKAPGNAIYSIGAGPGTIPGGQPSAGAGGVTEIAPGLSLEESKRQAKAGELAAKREFDKPAAKSAVETAFQSFDELKAVASDLKNNPNLYQAFGAAAHLPTFSLGGDKANIEAKLTTLKSKVAFAALQAMRDASKTGGALGAISEKELLLLENAIAPLMQTQGVEQAKESLQKIISYVENSRARIAKAYKDTYGEDLGSGGAKAPVSVEPPPGFIVR